VVTEASAEVRVSHGAEAYLDERSITAWDEAGAIPAIDEREPGAALRSYVRTLGERGLLARIDGDVSWRAVCLVRERLGHTSPLLDLAFAMQGLGSYPITLAGDEAQRARWMPDIVAGKQVAAFALTEPEAGSDLSGISTRARRDGDHYVLDGHKIFISNAGVADVYTLFARTSDDKRPLSAFVISASALVARPTKVLGGHPIGELELANVRVPIEDRLGDEGDGMRIALGTLHRFRPTVGAAALGFAQRALDESVNHVRHRRQFGRPLADQQAVQLALADMACDIEAARLLVYRAAALADRGASQEDAAYAGSIAKLVATERAFAVVDRAVQLHGGRGVVEGHPVARLYEDVRALRIYEGASDIQRVLIARELLRR
jgi:acyl-CoA dehydrogenase